MDRLTMLRLLGVAGLLALVPSFLEGSEPPNVIVMITDDQGYSAPGGRHNQRRLSGKIDPPCLWVCPPSP